jgi:integrase
VARKNRKIRGIIEDPKGSGRLALRFKDQDRIMRKERLGKVSLSFAVTVLEKRRTEVKEGIYFRKRAKATSFKEIARDFLSYSQVNKRSFKDDRVFIGFWLTLFGDKRGDEITPEDIEKGKEELAKSRAAASVNRYLAALKTAFSRAVKNGKLERNPVKAVKMFKENNARVRYLKVEEEAALMGEIPEEYRPIILVALHTGLRRGELFSLKRDNIDFRTETITISRTKNGGIRHVPMNKVVMETLRRMPTRLKSEYVFVSRLGIPINAHNFYGRVFKPALKRAGIKDFRFHDLRHTFASRLAMQGVSLLANKELMGHKTIAMTQRYAHLSPSHLKEAVEGLCKDIDGTEVSQLVSQANIGVETSRLNG